MSKLDLVKKAILTMQRYPWEQGVTAQAMLEAGEKEWAILLAREAVHRSSPDGRVANMGSFPGITDPCANGEAIGFAKAETKDSIFAEAFDKLLIWAMISAPRNENGIVYHVESESEFWVDSMYMLPPFLAYAGEFDEAIKQINGYWEALYDEDKGLLSHIWHDGKKTFTRRDFWGVGNGWTLAGLSRVIHLLPSEMLPQKMELAEKALSLLINSLKYMREDFLFHNVLDDPNSFIETNFPQMMAYSIYRGIKDGWLKCEDQGINWLELAGNIRKAVNNKVDRYGYVQGVCGAPEFSSSGYAVEGQAFFILMESAAAKLDS